jgi:multicomponent Na+:H+ antiporter subunit B
VSRRTRLALFAPAIAVVGALLVWGLAGLPDFGHYAGEYGKLLAHIAVPRRSATDVVTSTTFDFRGFDTLGEEFILFAAAVGVGALLRAGREEGDAEARIERAEEKVPAASETTRLGVAALVGPTLLFGIYVVTHGQLTPGGGFQGGVILAAAAVLFYLSGRHVGEDRIPVIDWFESDEGFGAAGFALIGFGGLVFAAAFLENFLPAGNKGSLLSGGTIPLSNIAVGIEVMGALLVIFSEFLEQQFLSRRGGGG